MEAEAQQQRQPYPDNDSIQQCHSKVQPGISRPVNQWKHGRPDDRANKGDHRHGHIGHRHIQRLRLAEEDPKNRPRPADRTQDKYAAGSTIDRQERQDHFGDSLVFFCTNALCHHGGPRCCKTMDNGVVEHLQFMSHSGDCRGNHPIGVDPRVDIHPGNTDSSGLNWHRDPQWDQWKQCVSCNSETFRSKVK